jgi:hypothetical protein
LRLREVYGLSRVRLSRDRSIITVDVHGIQTCANLV